MPTFKQLKYFDAVARFNHFGKAALYCAISQPALSMQIKELERELGIQLFERNNKRAIITKHGIDLLERSRTILKEMQNLKDYAQSTKGQRTGPLNLGVIPTIAPYLLPKLLPSILQKHPDLSLILHETQTHMLIEKLEDGDLDLLVLALPVNTANTISYPLTKDNFLLALPPQHKVSTDTFAIPSMFDDGQLLLLEEGHCLREQALTFCHLQEISKFATVGASSLSTLVQMVSNGLGMTLLPEISISVENRNNDVKLIEFQHPIPSREIGLVWRKNSPRGEDFMKLGELIQQVLQAAKL
jgi:LysR family hydrogen peroxide-inducible transcriptional activator